MLTINSIYPVSNMLNKLHGQPESYDKKYASRTGSQECPDCPAERNIDSVEPLVPVHMELSERQIAPAARSL
jgi:hypothetical protein